MGGKLWQDKPQNWHGVIIMATGMWMKINSRVDSKPTFDYIRSLGMKPGLWISIGAATRDAKVFREHPEWFVENRNNKPGNLHFVADSSDFYTSCFGTDGKII